MNTNIENIEREFDWNEAIENEGTDFIILPEGDYDFEITSFERQRHDGSDKLPACNKAVVFLKIEAPEGTAVIKHNLFLHSKTEGMLCAFFTAIGQRKKGERITMNWNTVVGSTGRAKIIIDKWTNKDGVEYTSNKVKKFYEKETIVSEPKGYQPGKF